MQFVTDIPSSYYRISLKAIIRNEYGEVLVNREAGRNDWSLPGGGWDHGETDIECLKRELFEELGYSGELTARPVATTREPMFMPSKKAWLLWIVYDVKTQHMDFKVGEESDAIQFIDPNTFKDSESNSERLVYQFCATKDLHN